MTQIFDRTNGRPKDVSPERAREMMAASPGRYTADPNLKAPISEQDWGAMTSGERLASSMTRDRALKGR